MSLLLLLACAGRPAAEAPVEAPVEAAVEAPVPVEAAVEAPAAAPAAAPPAGAAADGPRVEAWAMNIGAPGRPECLWAVEDGVVCGDVSVGPVRLAPGQIARLEALLETPETFGEPLSKCFLPHHAFTWRDAEGAVVQQVSICFLCDNLRSQAALAALPDDPNLQGFSAAGRAGLQGLCEELGLPNCEGTPP